MSMYLLPVWDLWSPEPGFTSAPHLSSFPFSFPFFSSAFYFFFSPNFHSFVWFCCLVLPLPHISPHFPLPFSFSALLFLLFSKFSPNVHSLVWFVLPLPHISPHFLVFTFYLFSIFSFSFSLMFYREKTFRVHFLTGSPVLSLFLYHFEFLSYQWKFHLYIFMKQKPLLTNCEINDRHWGIYTVGPPALLSMQKIGWQIIKISSPCQYFTQIDSSANSPRNWHFFRKPFPFSAPIASFNNWTRMQGDQKVSKNKTKVCFWILSNM